MRRLLRHTRDANERTAIPRFVKMMGDLPSPSQDDDVFLGTLIAHSDTKARIFFRYSVVIALFVYVCVCGAAGAARQRPINLAPGQLFDLLSPQCDGNYSPIVHALKRGPCPPSALATFCFMQAVFFIKHLYVGSSVRIMGAFPFTASLLCCLFIFLCFFFDHRQAEQRIKESDKGKYEVEASHRLVPLVLFFRRPLECRASGID